MERSEDDGSHCCLASIGRLQVTSTPNSDHIALVIVLDLYLIVSPCSVSHSYCPCFTAEVQMERSEDDGSHCCLVAIGRLQVTSTPNSDHIALVIVLDLYLIVSP